jgi:beta-glucosidase
MIAPVILVGALASAMAGSSLAQTAAPVAAVPAPPAPGSYPFQDATLPADHRIANLLSLMTIDEKIDALSTQTGVPRLGVPSFGSSEGIHGVVQRGNEKRGLSPIPTTQFPQPPGMGDTWDPDLVRQAAGVEGHEARFISQTDSYKRHILMPLGAQRRGLWRRSVRQRHHGGGFHPRPAGR